jgi:hypothetical protein
LLDDVSDLLQMNQLPAKIMLLADSYVKVYEIGKLIQHGHDLKELEL